MFSTASLTDEQLQAMWHACSEISSQPDARQASRRLSERLSALGLKLTPSVANFVLPRFPDDPERNADAAFAFLHARGILVRKMAAYGLPQHLRITIGTGEEMERVAAALAEFMGRNE